MGIGCLHESLRMQSGGYYIACTQCSQRWVAIRPDGSDTDVDHTVMSPLATAPGAWTHSTLRDLTRPYWDEDEADDDDEE